MNRNVHYGKHLGQYNWASDEKSWCLSLYTPYGSVQETFDEGDEPEIDDLLPSEVLELISKRLESYWISTRREEDRKKIEAIRMHASEIDQIWLAKQIELARDRVSQLEVRLGDLESEQAEEEEA